MSNTSSAAKAPVLPHRDWDGQFHLLYHSSREWIETNWLQIAFAFAIYRFAVPALVEVAVLATPPMYDARAPSTAAS